MWKYSAKWDPQTCEFVLAEDYDELGWCSAGVLAGDSKEELLEILEGAYLDLRQEIWNELDSSELLTLSPRVRYKGEK